MQRQSHTKKAEGEQQQQAHSADGSTAAGVWNALPNRKRAYREGVLNTSNHHNTPMFTRHSSARVRRFYC